MKRFLKLVTICVVGILCLGCCGCKKTGPIPNGCYAWQKTNFVNGVYEDIYKFVDQENRDLPGLEVKGDTVELWYSGSVEYKAKIIQKEDGIYFEGYKWRGILNILFDNGRESGNTNIYYVEYNETENRLTLILVEND